MNARHRRSFARLFLPAVAALALAGCGSSSQGPTPTGSSPTPSNAKPEFLYATGENQILSFTIDSSTGSLSTAVATPGPDTTLGFTATIAADPASRFLFVLDTKGNAIDVFSINATTGALTASGSPFPTGLLSLPGGLATDLTGHFLYVAGVPGIAAFMIDSTTGALTAVAGSPFFDGGSFGVVADPTGNFIYTGDTGSPAVISGFSISPSTGALTPVKGSPFSTFTTGGSPFSLAAHPSGKFLYAGLPVTNTVEAWSIDGTGTLAVVSGSPFSLGGTSITIDPTGKFLYAPAKGGVYGFAIDTNSGALTPSSSSPFQGLAFEQLIIDPSGLFMYSPLGTFISGINIDPSTGALTAMDGSPFNTGVSLTPRPTLVIVQAP